MADLRILLENLGYKHVKTYIQSGNLYFQDSKLNKSLIEDSIKNEIKKKYGFQVPVIVKTQKELARIFAKDPFSVKKEENRYFILLKSNPKIELINQINLIKQPDEDFIVAKDCIYLYTNNYGKSKYNSNFFEKKTKGNNYCKKL